MRRTTIDLPGRAESAHAFVPATLYGGVNGFLKNMIEAIADSKLRRLERELELRGIRLDALKDEAGWRRPGQAGEQANPTRELGQAAAPRR